MLMGIYGLGLGGLCGVDLYEILWNSGASEKKHTHTHKHKVLQHVLA